MANRPITTKPEASAMVSLLDWIYRRGVDDAYTADDEGLCREFLAKTEEPGVFGFLDNCPIDWDEWCLRLMMQARRTSWNGAMSRYLQAAGRFQTNYLSVFYNVALLAYRNGISDYINAPNGTDKQQFDAKTRVLWSAKGCLNVSLQEYVDNIQLQCFDLARRDKQITDKIGIFESRKLGCLTSNHYLMFRRAIALALMSK